MEYLFLALLNGTSAPYFMVSFPRSYQHYLVYYTGEFLGMLVP